MQRFTWSRGALSAEGVSASLSL